MGARIAVPLGVLLPCLAVSLAAAGAVATGVAMVSGTSGYLARQADEDVLTCTGSLLSRGLVMVPGSVPPGACGIELLGAGGQVLVPAAAGGPVVPPGRSWLAAHLGRPVTVPGTGSSGRWRMIITTVRYQARRIPYAYGPDDMRYVVSGPAGRGQAGLTAVMAGLASAGQLTGRVAAGYAAAAGVVLVLLAGAALAAARAILRPLRQGAGFAGTAEVRGPPPAEISGRLRASRAAEAAARHSARQMSRRLGEISLELRTSVNVVHGFAQYCRERGAPPAAGLDQMMRRVAHESARMDALLHELRETSAPPARDP